MAAPLPAPSLDAQDRPVFALTAGDPNGIGPEVVLKALQSPELQERVRCVVVGSVLVMEHWAERLGLREALNGVPSGVKVVDVALDGPFEIEPGQIRAGAGRLAMESVARACDLCLSGEADAMVTAPISKEAIKLGGYDFPGHTEFLAERTNAERFAMMLVSDGLRPPIRIALLTIHEPIARVAGLITNERITETLQTVSNSLVSDFGIAEPRIAVLGLNPHAGDGGVLGREEIEIIQPALEAAQAAGLDVSGPFAADGFFGRRGDKEFDAVLAMYHDQGLAPFKALAMGAGVNVTLGLPIVRTSPDHGTAFGIAGQGVASVDSMVEAIRLAADIVGKRKAANS